MIYKAEIAKAESRNLFLVYDFRFPPSHFCFLFSQFPIFLRRHFVPVNSQACLSLAYDLRFVG